jgi:hypothetical protein
VTVRRARKVTLIRAASFDLLTFAGGVRRIVGESIGLEFPQYEVLFPCNAVDRHLAHSKESAMHKEKITADRLTAFSDGVFAVILTIMVLDSRAPDQPAFSAL